MKLLYLDTNILVYSSGQEKNLFGKDISTSSSKLLYSAILCNYELVISSWLLDELSAIRKLDQASMVLQLIDKKVRTIKHTREDIKQAKEIDPDNYQDALHGLLALRSKADYLVTRNISDFNSFYDKISIVKPEELE